MRTLYEELKIAKVFNGTTGTADGNLSTFIDMTGFRRALFAIQVASNIAANIVVKARVAEDAAGTDAEDILNRDGESTIGGTFTNGTDDGKIGLIEVQRDRLAGQANHFVGLHVAPGGSDATITVMAILDQGVDAPVSVAALAFAVGG